MDRIEDGDTGGTIAAAMAALEEERSRQAPPRVVDDLFGRTPREDLDRYAPAELAELANAAYDHLRKPRAFAPGADRHDLLVVDRELAGDGTAPGRELTLVEVVNDDMPFLLDSTLAEIVDQGYEPRLVAHPILTLRRDEAGRLVELIGPARGAPPAGAMRESLIHIHLDRLDEEARERLRAGLERVYADVAVAVADWGAMRERLAGAIRRYRETPPPLPAQETEEALAFLDWIAADNFTLLGVREYSFPHGDVAAAPIEGSGLGILRDPAVKVLRRGRELVAMTPEVRAFLEKPSALITTKANVKSRVHRRAHLDYVGIKLFSDVGEVAGELRVVGLFTASAYTESTDDVPVLRLKRDKVLERAEFDPQSHAGRALINVLENYPRDELFQIDEETLYDFALEIMNLADRPRVRVLARPDEFDRFVSVLVFIPKDRYDTQVRRKVGEFLAGVYQGRVSAAYPAYPEGPLARTHYIIGREEGETPDISRAQLEDGVGAIVRTWGDALRDALREEIGGPRARTLAARYADAFSAAYREAFSAHEAIRDILIVERISADRPRAVDLYRREGDPETRVNLKVFSRGAGLPLSERVPLLENLGFHVVNERTYRVLPAGAADGDRVWLHDMTLTRAAGGAITIERIEKTIEAALLALFRGFAESDGFNKLVLEAELGWRDVAMIRALARYLRQVRIAYGQDYLATTLARHPDLAAAIVDYFYARFDPRVTDRRPREEAEAEVRGRIEEMLGAVQSLDDDRILRRFVNLVEATLRTNYFQIEPNGQARRTIAFKIECAKVEAMPLPRPLYEVFVYSPRVEGLHLRFGKVARGGLRWSDRPQDFRTEVLGLVKAQQVKNAVIVPVGAKGGFVPKRLPPASDRQAWFEEGRESYKVFIDTLLELTDNIVGDDVRPPPDTVRHDGDDPYLVVAADKGTATFSDTANALSLARGHWLGDAFASGGSNGYDHKGMGITARGAWEAVKRHFREMDVDIQSQPVTVAGVGDMSGDVFGNGMLLSRAIKLVAAFDHRDIFIDPNPDPEASFTERKRLFDLGRSSWADYDASLISPGGGVFSRSLKAIPLTDAMRALLDLDQKTATPFEVMRAILRMRVDLLWFGGIGTYIRAASETDEAVGDRANDAIRVTGGELRARVIGEGANLGVTQLGRIEAARRGVRLNTDAIDNSAGVNTSDVEVNIKIALDTPLRDGRLTPDARNALLAEMTEEVAGLVLRNNYLQTLSLSLAERRGAGDVGFVRRLMQGLEHEGRLDRGVEQLPDDVALTARAEAGEGLTRPELAVLLAYAKLQLYDQLLASPVPDDPYLGRELDRYFPAALQERFEDAIQTHRLRREIIATQLSNAIVNRGGPTVIARLADATGADAPTIAAAYAAARDSFGLVALNAGVDALDNAVGGALQLTLYAELEELAMNRIGWFIRNVDLDLEPLDAIIGRFREGVVAVEEALADCLPDAAQALWRERTGALTAQAVPETLARRLAALPILVAAPDIVLIAGDAGRSIRDVAATYFALDETFRLGTLAAQGRDVAISDYYDRLALERALSGVADAHRRLTAEIAREQGSGRDAVEAWCASRPDVTRIRTAVDGIVSSGLTLSKLTVAASLLGDLTRG
ncbi:NAD-glutamate dehydrogenase [Salinarimonas rosea]|uniref:NAD-glutamate dehydrogenase n=1 Tax=Salinarimonas rosea TaxID=552063 RepID=UPI000420EA49